MKRKLINVTSICCFMLIVSLCQAADTVKDVNFVIDPWPPWSYGEEGKSPEKGIAIEIIQKIFTRLDGFEPKFSLYPWKRCLYLIEKGEKDALALAAYNKERAEFAKYTDEVVRNKAIILYRKGAKPIWSTLEDLKKYKIGVLAGNDYGNIFTKAAEEYGYKVDSGARSAVKGVLKLQYKRYDMFLTTETSASAVFTENAQNMDGIERMDSPFSDGDIYYLAFSKKSPYTVLIPRINKIIVKLKTEGFIERVLNKYLNN